MPIVFHCEHCGKKIEAADSAGGKWGKCPACHNKLYVPNLNADIGDLKLAPIDEKEEERRRQLMAETYQLTQDILQEREIPEGMAEAPQVPTEVTESELNQHILQYLRHMADGNLGESQRLVNVIAAQGQRAIKILDRIALSDMPEPELADIPPQVLSGLIRTLRNRIG